MVNFLHFRQALALVFFFCFVLSETAVAQTKGMIVRPATGAGRTVLDPNSDGYVSSPSATPAGFKSNDVLESEIPYKAIPVPAGEVLGDLLRGPNDGFSDFSYLNGNLDPVATYVANGNLMFRFRQGGIAPNAKGYSILIDTDNKFGGTGPSADPNFTPANPGFEVEVVLATGFGVQLYNVDGISTPSNYLVQLPYEQYAQKAVAYTAYGGTPDYFYDFYIPFSEITSRIPSFTANTPVRMVANTVMSPHSALAGPISDVGGIDDKTYAGNYASAFTYLINNAVPTPLATTSTASFPPVRTAAPAITGTYSAGASTSSSPISVTGTSAERAGTVITVYRNGVMLGSTTVGANSSWTYTLPVGSSLTAGDKLTATATASGMSESLPSSQATVFAPAFTCSQSATPTITCSSDKGFIGTVPTGVAAGSIIRIFKFGEPNAPVAGIPDIPVKADGTWGWNCRDGISATACTPGQGCVGNTIGTGSYYAVLEEGGGKCTSPRSNDVCVGNNTKTSAAPTLTTTPIRPSTASLSGTAVAGAKIIVLLDGALAGNTVATAGSWTFSGLVLRSGQLVTVRALVDGMCVSAAVTATVAAEATTPPTVAGPVRAGATVVSGTSSEPAGTAVSVFRNGTSICGGAGQPACPVVDAYGNWTLSGISTTLLAAGNTITATALATNKSLSTFSNSVTVTAAPTLLAVPAITGSYTEGATAVSGTGPANSTINLYIDDFYLGSVTSGGSGTWTVAGLSGSDIRQLLYAGGVLTATSGTVGSNESAASNKVVVQCSTAIPDRTKAVSTSTPYICQNSSATIFINNSEAGISYVLRNEANTADLSSSVLGNGSTITLTSYPLAATQHIRVAATRVESPGCGYAMLDNSVTVTVNPNPLAFKVQPTNQEVCRGSEAFLVVESSQVNVSYQIISRSDNSVLGTAVAGTGGQLALSTGVLNTTGSFTFYVRATSNTAPTNCGTQMSNEVTLVVNTTPAADKQLVDSGVHYDDATMDVIVVKSEPGILYQLRSNKANIGTPVTGTGGDIKLRTDKVPAGGKVYNVLATNPATGCAVELTQTLEMQALAPLPVELVYFRAKSGAGIVQLNWRTASEKDNKHFEVQRSADGRAFTKIAIIDGRGNTSTATDYTYNDDQPLEGQSYYRLKQEDFDGTADYSFVVAVTHQQKQGRTVTVAPNPFTDGVNVSFKAPVEEEINVQIRDISGRMVFSRVIQGTAGKNTLELSLRQLPKGLYLLQFSSKSLNITEQLIKH